MAAAILAGVIGVPGGASATHVGCGAYPPETVFLYCGEHIRDPLVFKVNPSGSKLSSALVEAATRDAVAQWNLFWPAAATAPGCSGDPLCYGGTTSAGFGRDGKNTILWGDPGWCGSGHGGGIGVACLWYESSQGAGRHRIDEVDIVLNASLTWRQPRLEDVKQFSFEVEGTDVRLEGFDLVLGEATSTVPAIGSELGTGGGWYDVQSAITHELGHALGLEDIGDTTARFPSDVRDAPKYGQTMYRWYYARSTDKRTINYGDVAGLQLAARDAREDGF